MAATCHGDGTCKGVSEAISGARELRGHDLDYPFFLGGNQRIEIYGNLEGDFPYKNAFFGLVIHHDP